MEQKSSRHHYIPRFIITRFCNDNGKTFLFEKKKCLIREVSPKQVFFGWDRNTFDYKGEQIDNVEKFYADLDSMFANVLSGIEAKEDISSTEMMYLVFLANSLKWRVPASDKSFKEWKDRLSFENLGIGFNVKDKVNGDKQKEFEENIDSDISKEFKRMLIAVQPVRFKHIGEEILKGLFLLRTKNSFSVLGDNPIIELKPDTEEFIEDFIFPISELDSLVYKKDSKRNNVIEYFYLIKDVAQLHLAENYIICRNKDYLEKIIEAYDNIKKQGKQNMIVKGLFQTIE